MSGYNHQFDSLLRAFDAFCRLLDAATIPIPGGGRKVSGIAHAVALSEATDDLHRELAATHARLVQEHGQQLPAVPSGVQLLESDSPDGPWRPIEAEAIRVHQLAIGGDGADAVLLAALESATNVAAFPSDKWNAMQSQSPAAKHQRWHTGETITAEALSVLESAEKLLRLAAERGGNSPQNDHLRQVQQLAARFEELHRRVSSGQLAISRRPNTTDVIMPADAEFCALAADAGNVLADVPEHWRFGLQSSTVNEVDPGKRWSSALFDWSLNGLVDVPNWDDADQVERIEATAQASVLGCQVLMRFANRPNWGKGYYASALEFAQEAADDLLSKVAQDEHHEAAVLFALTSSAFGAACALAKMSRKVESLSPSQFVYQQTTLDESWKRLQAFQKATALAAWPQTPGTSFSWMAVGDSALDAALQFSQAILAASLAARAKTVGMVGRNPPELCVAESNPDPKVVAWRDATAGELQDRTLQPLPAWPMWEILRDERRLVSLLRDEYRRARNAQAPRQASASAGELYKRALQIVFDTGRKMEAHPSTYLGKGETAIRDHLLTVLESHFQHVCGERFNKTGKTDIFVEHDGNAVLISECKIWDGKKSYLAALDQLLSYLPWRDARAAVFVFVQTKEIGPVLEQIQDATPTHRCFAAELDRPCQGWYRFQFLLNDDSAQSLDLAVICFHFPPSAQGVITPA